jgi:hypothetical protein
MQQTEIVVLNFNRLDPFRKLLDWLHKADGVGQITVIDNASTYPPLLDFYQTQRSFNLIRQSTNGDHHTPLDYLKSHYTDRDRFIVTDPDLVPYEDCPLDLIPKMRRLLDKHQVQKVGVGLEVDDLPDHYPFKDGVYQHEKQLLGKWFEDGSRLSVVDTTFALYRSYTAFSDWRLPAIRTGIPYMFQHVDWYLDPDNLSEEYIYYLDHSSPVASYAERMRDWFRKRNRDWHRKA